ncbi:MAG: alpha-mannosidase [Actinomycetota bacterium]|jgi:hypothetical protein|nr:alpha-mannosidase [Actinomycetota bacterium]
MARRVAIVPHTHWDREWYEPFESFRLRLVDVLDELVPLLERDPSYAHFLLDGQLAMVDDYLQVRPEEEPRVRALAASQRLTVGPWYVLMDEFLVSGETIVRNLQAGMARAAELGGAMEVGYLPDMFGHVAQMPQILTLAGLHHAVVWRGVPSEVDRSAFWWEAPDGSTVRAEYLPTGYSNGAAVPDDAEALVRRLTEYVATIEPFVLDTVLVMNGTDHQAPQRWLGRVVAEANAMQDDLVLEVTSLPAYLAGAPTTGLPHWSGELRSGHRANVLMGVASNRVDVKQAAAATERSLERRAEPYAALFGNPERRPQRLLDIAWREVVRNSAHDSICACSVDAVVDAVLGRFAGARAIADGIADRALADLAASLPGTGPTVVNPSARTRHDLVEIVITGDAPPEVQTLEEVGSAFGIPRGLGTLTLDAGTVRSIIALLPEGTRVDDHTWIHDVRVAEDGEGLDITIALGAEERAGVDVSGVRSDLVARLEARPDAPVRIRLDQPPTRTVLARVGPVPGYGWQPAVPAPIEHPVRSERPTGPGGPLVMANGLVEVVVDPATGTFAVDGIVGFGRIVDDGDLGDSYNYSPPGTDIVVDTADRVIVLDGDHGPLRATATIQATYTWPDHVDGPQRARVGSQPVEVTTSVEVRADDPVVRVETSFTNACRDHRVRVHLPLPRPVDGSEAECAFTVVRRGLTAEGRPEELGLPTFPSRRFVRAGTLTVVHDGLCEYELVDLKATACDETPTEPDGPLRAHTLALTILRATGMLSRLGMAYRPMPAGPLTPVPGLQMLGRDIRARYAVCLADVDPYVMADEVLLPVDVVHAFGGGSRPPAGRALDVTGAEVSCVRRVPGALEVRVFNPTGDTADVGLGGRSGWLVDLRGRPVQPVSGSFDLRPFGIATIHLTSP